jgi:flagellar biosynthesis protein FlhG
LALRIIVNLCADPMQATDVHRRLDRSCRQFLGLGIAMLGHVPQDEQVKRAVANARPFVLNAPSSPAACAVQHLTAALAASPTSFPRAV